MDLRDGARAISFARALLAIFRGNRILSCSRQWSPIWSCHIFAKPNSKPVPIDVLECEMISGDVKWKDWITLPQRVSTLEAVRSTFSSSSGALAPSSLSQFVPETVLRPPSIEGSLSLSIA